MEPEPTPSPEGMPPADEILPAAPAHDASDSWPDSEPLAEYHGLRWIFFAGQEFRAIWSTLTFILLLLLFMSAVSAAFSSLHLIETPHRFSAGQTVFSELILVLSLLGAVTIMALIERRSLSAYYLTGPRRVLRFFSGVIAGFAALSLLVGMLCAGGWLHFDAAALSGSPVLLNATLWGVAFFLVACFEEGTFRCYLQFTFARGMNFWYALGTVALFCVLQAARHGGNGAWGLYAIAMLGLVPCFVLHQKAVVGNAFWQATWATSTFFGFVHTGNGGENWIGIFAAAAIGVVFCVSIRVTGSAWWAIGFHASWDWAETFFYGTADSGMRGEGHYLTTSPTGNPLWSGGANGPEGSLLILGVLLLLIVYLLALYGRRSTAVPIA